jgi:tetratricopeptide (TPR) repeat protein
MLMNISTVMSQNISVAKDFYEHNLKERALEEFIIVYNAPSSNPETRSEALYYMGQITFDDGRFSTALDDWKKLIDKFPTSIRAIEIKERLAQLNEVFSKSVDENISSSVAKSYIKNGDFWYDDSRGFTIDASWLPKVELAIDWYDKVILEFPKTYAAELAYKRKLFTILGWKESGQYGSSYGVRNDYKKYMPILLKTFDEFESSFPESSYLQGFRYQIAQTYWGSKDWDNTRIWLNKIIDKSNGQPSFYSETAKARLKKLEY